MGTKKPRRKRGSNASDTEKILQATQAVAGAGILLYRAIKPHIKKIKSKLIKRREPKQP